MTKDMIISTTALVTGRGDEGQGHVRVNGFVKEEVRGEEEEKNCLGEGGRTEERNIWDLVRCYTVRGQWHIIHKICMIQYSVNSILCIWRCSRKNYLATSDSSWRQTPNH